MTEVRNDRDSRRRGRHPGRQAKLLACIIVSLLGEGRYMKEGFVAGNSLKFPGADAARSNKCYTSILSEHSRVLCCVRLCFDVCKCVRVDAHARTMAFCDLCICLDGGGIATWTSRGAVARPSKPSFPEAYSRLAASRPVALSYSP